MGPDCVVFVGLTDANPGAGCQSVPRLAMATEVWISRDPAMAQVVLLARKASCCRSNVLIVGESGVGKTYIARQIHQASLVSRQGFHTILCPFGTEYDGWDLMEALQGISRSGGTVLLKAVDSLSVVDQRRLLGFLDKRASEDAPRPDIRFMFTAYASEKCPGSSRLILPELRFRISVITIEVPPLRKRRVDLIWLAKIFLKESSKKQGKVIKGLAPSAQSLLLSQPWDGNIWQLRAVMDTAAAICVEGSRIDDEILNEALRLTRSFEISNGRLSHVRDIGAQLQ